MNWANEMYNGRLRAEFHDTYIVFHDLEMKESVFVRIDDSVVMSTTKFGHDLVKVISIDDARHFTKGSGISQRNVYHFVTKDHCTVLRAGLTVHRSAFSSTPHSFEFDTEPGFEEVFFFRTDGKVVLEGEGLWPDGQSVDAAWPVRDGQFAQVPMGWHRVVAMADVDGQVPSVSYIWCYLCLHERWEK